MLAGKQANLIPAASAMIAIGNEYVFAVISNTCDIRPGGQYDVANWNVFAAIGVSMIALVRGVSVASVIGLIVSVIAEDVSDPVVGGIVE